MPLTSLAPDAPTLPLDTFRAWIGSHPYHFWNITGTSIPVDKCDDLTKLYAWQNSDRVGREDIANALIAAEQLYARDNGYAIAPHFVEETIDYPAAYYNHSLIRSTANDAYGRWSSVTLREGYVQKVGVEVYTLLGTVGITLSDSDGDGVNDTFVSAGLATTLTGTQINQIEAMFSAADRLDNESAGGRWRVAPVAVTITGGNVYVRGKAWLVTKPVKQTGVSATGLDVATSANFVTTLDIYQHYADPTGTTADTVQSVLTWEQMPSAGCCSDLTYVDASGDPAALATAYARVGIRNSKLGSVYLGESVYNATTGFWGNVGWSGCIPPARALVRYQAGYPLQGGVYSGTTLQNGVIAPELVRIICMLTAAELPKPIDACSTASRTLAYWQFDLARSSGANDEAYGMTTREVLNCPYGTRRGHVYAWQEFKRKQLVHSTTL